jgi:hypothetical protein
MKKSWSVLIFEEYLQSEKIIEHYAYHINRFAKYFELPSWDSILALEITDLKEKTPYSKRWSKWQSLQ